MAGAIHWLQANWAVVMVPLLIAGLDFAFAIKPEWKSNGLLHFIYLSLGGKKPEELPGPNSQSS